MMTTVTLIGKMPMSSTSLLDSPSDTPVARVHVQNQNPADFDPFCSTEISILFGAGFGSLPTSNNAGLSLWTRAGCSS